MIKFSICVIACCLLTSCGQVTPSLETKGTFMPHTITQAGPGVFAVSTTVSLKDTNGVELRQLTTDSSGNGVALLAPGHYKWGLPKPTQMVPDQQITIQPNTITRDTLNLCPWCV